MAKALLIIARGAILIGAIWWAASIWTSFGGADLSTDATIAMWLGISVSLIVGIGLMLLVFQSSRRGYDESVRFETPGQAPPSLPAKKPSADRNGA